MLQSRNVLFELLAISYFQNKYVTDQVT